MVTPAAAWGVLVVWAELLGGRVAPVGGRVCLQLCISRYWGRISFISFLHLCALGVSLVSVSTIISGWVGCVSC